jgi:hypothetical protein
MNEILMAILMVSCPKTVTINRTKYEWNKHDLQIIKTCKKRCPELYKDAPCLKKFIKYGEQDYDCICGK